MIQIATNFLVEDCLPSTPSPLVLRDPNSCPRFPFHMTVARRSIKDDKVYSPECGRNPLLQRRSAEQQDRRRRMFLTRVKRDGDERRWEARSEQVGIYSIQSTRSVTMSLCLFALDSPTRFPEEETVMGSRASA